MAQVYVEVRPRQATGGDLKPRAPVTEVLAKRIDEIADSLREVATRMAARFNDFAANTTNDWKLSDVELKFSLDLEAEAGVIIARTSASAGFEATLTWSKAKAAGEESR
jgi:hypothetical protein